MNLNIRKLSTGFILASLMGFFAHADRIHLLVDDKEAMQARADIIKAAQKEIYVEYYTVSDDDVSLGFFALLLEAAQRGVHVKLLVDALTSHAPNSSLSVLLKLAQQQAAPSTSGRWHSNFEIKVFNPFVGLNLLGITRRTHAKIVLADQQELITGGRNIGDHYFGQNARFVDVDIYVAGEEAKRTADNFLNLWNSSMTDYPAFREIDPDTVSETCEQSPEESKCNPYVKKQTLEKFNARVSEFSERIRILQQSGLSLGVDLENSNPSWLRNSKEYSTKMILDNPRSFINANNSTNGIGTKYLETLLQAQKTLTIVSPYLIPTKEEFAALKTLLGRNVKIKLITNSIISSDDLLAVAGYYQTKNEILALGQGIEIYEFEGERTLHAKLAIIDDSTAVVGTFNMDPRSFQLNREMAVVISAPSESEPIVELNHVINGFQEHSLLVGQDGIEMNVEKQKLRPNIEEREKKVRKYLKVMPLIRNQI